MFSAQVMATTGELLAGCQGLTRWLHTVSPAKPPSNILERLINGHPIAQRSELSRWWWSLIFHRFAERKIYPLLIPWPNPDEAKPGWRTRLRQFHDTYDIMHRFFEIAFDGYDLKFINTESRNAQGQLTFAPTGLILDPLGTRLQALTDYCSDRTTRAWGKAFKNISVQAGELIFVPIIVYYDRAPPVGGWEEAFTHEVGHVLEATLSPQEYLELVRLFKKYKPTLSQRSAPIQDMLRQFTPNALMNVHEFFAELFTHIFLIPEAYTQWIVHEQLKHSGLEDIHLFFESFLKRKRQDHPLTGDP